MRIWYHTYNLYPTRSMNRLAAREPRSGVLLKVEWDQEKVGYADCHPWPELGDPDLPSQLRSLRKQKPLSLAQRSLVLAEWDAEARAQDLSLIDSERIPESHYLIRDAEEFDPHSLAEIQEQGYRVAKVKVGRDPTLERHCVEKWLPFLNSGFRLRFDFNQALDGQAFRYWWHQLSSELQERTDFVEDPTPFSPNLWAQMQEWPGLSLALDRSSAVEEPALADVRVIKPAAQDVASIWTAYKKAKSRIVFTTSMDHPIGQAAAIASATHFYEAHPQLSEICGLQTAQVYEADEFSERIQFHGPHTLWPEGPGFGFSDLLENLKWEPLVGHEG